MSNTNNKHIIVTLFSMAICLLAASNNVYAQVPCGGYEVTAIVSMEKCPPFGVPPVIPLGINEQGWMVGFFNPCVIGANRAWLWTPDDGLVLIPTPAGTSSSRALAISGSKIVGHFDNTRLELGTTGFLYDFETDVFISLGTLPGADRSEAHAINSNEEIVGFWGNTIKGPSPLAFIWVDGEMIDLNPDFGTLKSEANDINSTGLVTGWMGSSGLTDARAYIWDDGKITELPVIPGGFTSEGHAINDRLDIVGRGRFFDPEINATVWRAFAYVNGEAINLGTIPGFEKSIAKGINEDQTIIGAAETNFARAFVWRDGEMLILNDLISPSENLDIRVASGINQAGQIACTGIDEFNDNVAVLLTPIEVQLGDLDNDCHVGVSDLLVLFSHWGLCANCKECLADLNQDCTVSVIDLLILFANWG